MLRCLCALASLRLVSSLLWCEETIWQELVDRWGESLLPGSVLVSRLSNNYRRKRMDLTTNALIYDLEQPRYFGAPIYPSHAPGYFYTLHRHHERGMVEARTSASGFMYTTEHSGTHIDALCHQAENLHLYGGREVDASIQTPHGFTELGVETIAPLVTRGILLDIARFRAVERIGVGHPIRHDELEAAAQKQGVSI